MTFRGKTAAEGVLSAAALNVVARAFLFLRHVLITAFIGLTGGLDAFNVAFYFIALFIMAPGDIADSIGVPHLVRSIKEGSEDGFRRLSAALFRYAAVLSLALSALILLLSPASGRLAAGFPEETRRMVTLHVLLLLPMALCYLPYRVLGSLFRARRIFHLFYLTEALIAFFGLAVYMVRPRSPYMIPIAWSAGYVGGFVFLYARARRSFGRTRKADPPAVRGFFRESARLAPAYLTAYLFVLTDLAFASALPTGSVSALSYGLLLAVAVPGILNIENVLITPLSETEGRGEGIELILKGILLVSVPVVAFTLAFPTPLVRAVFQRGAFTDASTLMTSSALVCYAVALPYFFAAPVLVRTFLVLRRMERINRLSILGVAINAALVYLFAMKLGFGIPGIALSTSLSGILLAGAYLVRLRREGVPLGTGHFAGTILPAAGASLAALLPAALIPRLPNDLLDIGARGAVFLLGVAILLKVLRTPDTARFEARIREAVSRKGAAGTRG